jgi:hypothetical protein
MGFSGVDDLRIPSTIPSGTITPPSVDYKGKLWTRTDSSSEKLLSGYPKFANLSNHQLGMNKTALVAAGINVATDIKFRVLVTPRHDRSLAAVFEVVDSHEHTSDYPIVTMNSLMLKTMFKSDSTTEASTDLAFISYVDKISPKGPISISGATGQAASVLPESLVQDFGSNSAEEMVKFALKQRGDLYGTANGAGRTVSDPDPENFDCSGLVYWAAKQAGYNPPSTFGNSYWASSAGIISLCRQFNTMIPIEEGINTFGAILIRELNDESRARGVTVGHVAISLGNGQTIEAAGGQWGVNVFGARKFGSSGGADRYWTHAAKLPGMRFSTTNPVLGTVPQITRAQATSPVRGITTTASNAVNNTTAFNVAFRLPEFRTESTIITGRRSFMNDEKLLMSLQYVMKSSLREFQSAPNGDFIGWFPDYFGYYSGTPTMNIRNIEVVDLKIYESDDSIATHVAVAGNTASPTQTDLMAKLNTTGIVSVEDEGLMKILFNLDANTTYDSLSARSILQKYGMRPLYEYMPALAQPDWEYMYALFLFMKSWAAMTQVSLQLTFMPELYPGMRIRLPDSNNLEMYVESVSHSGSTKGQYTTNVSCIAPTRNGKLLRMP